MGIVRRVRVFSCSWRAKKMTHHPASGNILQIKHFDTGGKMGVDDSETVFVNWSAFVIVTWHQMTFLLSLSDKIGDKCMRKRFINL